MTVDNLNNKKTDKESKIEQDRFAEKVRHVLDESTDDIDELTLSRIRAARANAVSAADKKSAPGRGWIPVGSFATVLVAVLAVYFFEQGSVDITPAMEAGDMEMLSSIESLEMLDDLEFYQWLDMEFSEELEPDIESHAETLG